MSLPIKDLITGRMKELDMKRADLVSRLGYKNMEGGLRKLDNFLNDGMYNDFIATHFSDALDLSPEIIKETIEETYTQIKEEQEERERRDFQPHLVIQTEKQIPSSITICALTGGFTGHRVISLPEAIIYLKWEDQHDIIREEIRKYILKRKTHSFFGEVLGFIYIQDYDDNVEDRITFDLEGDLDPSVPKDFMRPQREGLFYKGRKIPFSLSMK